MICGALGKVVKTVGVSNLIIWSQNRRVEQELSVFFLERTSEKVVIVIKGRPVKGQWSPATSLPVGVLESPQGRMARVRLLLLTLCDLQGAGSRVTTNSVYAHYVRKIKIYVHLYSTMEAKGGSPAPWSSFRRSILRHFTFSNLRRVTSLNSCSGLALCSARPRSRFENGGVSSNPP